MESPFFFFNMIRKTTVQFLATFDNVFVCKYNADGTVNKWIKVPVKLAGKEKFWLWINDRRHETRLPMIGVNPTGIRVAKDRLTNQKFKTNFKSLDSNGTIYDIKEEFNIVPVDINYEVTFASLMVLEMSQLLEQTIPFYDPNIFIRVQVPEINNSFNIKVVLDSVNQQDNMISSEDAYRVLKYTLNFTAQSYVFKPVKPLPIIKEVHSVFHSYPLSGDIIHISDFEDSEAETIITREQLDA